MANCKRLIFLLMCGVVWGVTPSITTFNTGEVSPLLEARSDFAKYNNACRTLQNMIVTTQGPVARRPGTKYIATVKTSADEARIIPFEYSKSDAYILEFGDEYMRVYRNGGQVASAGSPYEITTVYDESELFEIQYVQSANTMYLVHPDHRPQKLTRTAHTAWTIASVSYTMGPFQAENVASISLTPSGTTGVITVTASEDIFDSYDVDSDWQITHVASSGCVVITDFTSTKVVSAYVKTTLNNTTATNTWAKGYWADDLGWPESLEFHEERLIYGGSASFPQTIWAGKTADSPGDYDDMTEGTEDTDAFIWELPGQNPIQWMLSQDYIIMGTLGGTGRLGDTDEALTPTTPEYRTQTMHGSAYIRAVMAGDAILYVENGGDKVREIVYSLERDRFVAPDLTILAEHITGDGIIDIAYQSRPDSVLWCVRSDGVLLSMTYERDHEVVAWARHVTEGSFESVAVIPGSDEDEVWVVANRTIDGSTVRYIEQLQPMDWGTDQDDCWFVDSGLTFNGGDAVNISDITQADPAVVTVSSWPVDGDSTDLADGDEVMIVDVAGMTELNDNIYTISAASTGSLTFALKDSSNTTDIDSTGFTAYTSGGTAQRFEKNFGGLSHLAEEEVAVWADGGPEQNLNVTSNAVQTAEWFNKVHIGLPYTSIIETLPVVFDTKAGSTSAMKKRVNKVAIDFYETLSASYGTDTDNLTAVEFTGTADPIPLFSGWREEGFQHGIKRKVTIYIETSDSAPMTVRAIIPSMEIYE